MRWIWIAVLSLLVVACGPSQEDSVEERAESPLTGEAPAPEVETPEEVVLGAAVSLTGTAASTGEQVRQAYELAVDLKNEEGGLRIGGEMVPVRLVLLDDTSDVATAVSLVDRLTHQEEVDLLLGTFGTDLVDPQSTVAEENQIPYVTGGGAATGTYQRGYQWLFSVSSSVRELARTTMRYLAEHQEAGNLPNPASIAVLWQNTAHGEDYLAGVIDVAEESGGSLEVVMDASFEFGASDFSPVLSRVQESGADIFLADTHLADFVTMHRQYLAAGMCHAFITHGGRGGEPEAEEALGSEGVAYIVSANWWDAAMVKDGAKPGSTFLNEFTEAYGATPLFYSALNYEAARAAMLAIEEAGTVEPQAVQTALKNLTMESILPGGEISFPEETGHQANYPFVMQQNQPDGKPLIYPSDVATGEGIVPNPNC